MITTHSFALITGNLLSFKDLIQIVIMILHGEFQVFLVKFIEIHRGRVMRNRTDFSLSIALQLTRKVTNDICIGDDKF